MKEHRSSDTFEFSGLGRGTIHNNLRNTINPVGEPYVITEETIEGYVPLIHERIRDGDGFLKDEYFVGLESGVTDLIRRFL